MLGWFQPVHTTTCFSNMNFNIILQPIHTEGQKRLHKALRYDEGRVPYISFFKKNQMYVNVSRNARCCLATIAQLHPNEWWCLQICVWLSVLECIAPINVISQDAVRLCYHHSFTGEYCVASLAIFLLGIWRPLWFQGSIL